MSVHNHLSRERQAYEKSIIKITDATLTGKELRENKYIICNKGSSMTLTFPAAIVSFDGMERYAINKGAGTVTIAYTDAAGAATRSLGQGATIRLDCDGDYWYAEPDLAGGIALASTKILVGSAGGAATARDLTGPWNMSNTGLLSMGSATVAGAGTNQSNAAALADGFTLASGGNGTVGVKLPTAAAGGFCIVKNNANAVLKLWPNSSDAIDALGANAVMSMPAYATVLLVAYDGVTWYSDVLTVTGTTAISFAINSGGNSLIWSTSGLGQVSTFTVPDVASDEVMMLGATQTATDKTFTAPVLDIPVIADFTAATHAHINPASGGAISAQAFGIIRISGQSDVIADANSDILTLSSADATIDFTSTAGTDTVDLSVIALDTADITEAAIADGDYIYFADGGSSGATKKEALHDVATLFAGNGLAATSSVIAFDPNSLTAAVLADGDSIVFIDAGSSNAPKKETIADLATLFAGDALTAASSVIGFTPTDLTDTAIADGDFIIFTDATASHAPKKEALGDVATLFAGTGLAATASVIAVDLNGVGAAVVDVTADSIVIMDANASDATKKESIDDFVTALAGEGLKNTSSQFALDLNELSDTGIANGDSIVFIDAGDSSSKKETIADVATLFAGTGLTATSSVIALTAHDVSEVTVDVAADSFILTDAGDSNATKRDTIADLIAAIAGNGLTATSGVLAVSAKTTWPMTLPGDIKLDTDQQGGPLVGLVETGDIAVTAEAAAFNLAYDTGTDGFETVLGTGAAWHNGEYLPTADANDDACYIGSASKFMEFAIDVSGTVGAYSGVGAGKYQYCKNGSADGTEASGDAFWGDLSIIQCTDDENNTTGADAGKNPWSSDGVTTFVPPSDWVLATINGQAAYWIRWIVLDSTKITTVGIPTDEHDTIRAAALSLGQMPHAGIITGYRMVSKNATVHSGTDVKVRLVNHTTVLVGDEETWTVSRRGIYVVTTPMTVAEGDMIGAVCTQEDSGNNDPLDVAFELDVTFA